MSNVFFYLLGSGMQFDDVSFLMNFLLFICQVNGDLSMVVLECCVYSLVVMVLLIDL